MQCRIVILLTFCQLLVTSAGEQLDECERSKCRTVRNVIYQDLISHYKDIKAKIPYKCPFFKDRDKYVANEEHKERESSSRWTCGYCGKAFIGELYLDKHFTNRHADSAYTQPDSVCLADYCEVFRCDVLSGVATPTFWDIALCMEEDMQDLAADCMELLDQCVPDALSWNSSKTLKGSLSKSVCSFLTCKKYYEAPESVQEEEPVRMPYVVMTVFLAIGLILYYCVAINYFCFDTFSDLYEDSDDAKNKSTGAGSLFADDTEDLQKRVMARHKKKYTVVDAENDRDDLFKVRKGLRASVREAKRSALNS